MIGDSSKAGFAVALVAATHLWTGPATRSPSATPGLNGCPVRVGERATYTAKYGPVRIGSAVATTTADTLRGKLVWHISIRIQGGIPLFRVDNRIDSWVDPDSMYALRFVQHLHQGRESFVREFDFHPEKGTMTSGGVEMPSVTAPFDDASMIFLVRHQRLEAGRIYESPRYFWPEANPVTIAVARRERVEVPAGVFDAVVVAPRISTSSVFRERSRPEVYLTDDSSKVLLRLKAHMPFGFMALNLRSVTYDSVSPEYANIACGLAPQARSVF